MYELQYSWTTEHVYPHKWCYIQDFDEESFHGYYDCMEKEPVHSMLVECGGSSQLAPLDPQMITQSPMRMRCIIFDVYVYEGDECIDGYEDESSEIMDRIFETHPHLQDKWDDLKSKIGRMMIFKKNFNGNMVAEEISGQDSRSIADTVEMIKMTNRTQKLRKSRLSIGKRLTVKVMISCNSCS